jgi:2-keto-myo-inositol isomerase
MSTPKSEFPVIALNASTLRGYELSIVEQIAITEHAGYAGIEPWVCDLEAHVSRGGSLADLRLRMDHAGLRVVDAIAFFTWAHADSAVRQAGLADARRQMEMVAAIGGCTIAAPPYGDVGDLSLNQFAEYYADLLALGRETGVMPLLELWGHAPRLSRLSELLYVAAACGQADAKLLLDVYHLYKGGNAFESRELINGNVIGLVHMNDYPAIPARAEIADKDRVWPGTGIAPLKEILATLRRSGYRGAFSLELFNPAYWKGDPGTTARIGLAKTHAVLRG